MLTDKPWQPDLVGRMGCGIFASLTSGMLFLALVEGPINHLSQADQHLVQFIVGTVSFQGVAVVLIALSLREHQTNWSAAFGLSTRGLARTLGLSVLMAIIIVFAALEMGSLISALMLRCGLTPEPQQAVQVMQQTVSWKRQLFYGTVAILLVPAVEEMIFRGMLYPTLKQMGYPRLALWGTSLLFGGIHFNLMALVPLAFVAVMLTLLYEETNNLLAPIVAHSLFNGANFAMMFHEREITRLLQW